MLTIYRKPIFHFKQYRAKTLGSPSVDQSIENRTAETCQVSVYEECVVLPSEFTEE